MSDQESPVPQMVDVYYCELHRAEQPITEPITKIGGAPVFFQPVEWPCCQNCGHEMGFLMQIRLDTPLRFSDSYAMAYVFMCATVGPDYGSCPTWEPHTGANAVILQPHSAHPFMPLIPDQIPRHDRIPDYTVELRPSQEPIIREPDTQHFVDKDEVAKTYMRLREQVQSATKIGGTPAWVQGEEVPTCAQCGGPMKYVAQLNYFGAWDEDQHYWIGPNFGDAGNSYVFLCEKECSPNGAAFLWQCS
jgi:hypothetical protein